MADAPRFDAYLDYGLGRPVLRMARDDWESLNVSSTNTALLDVHVTPMGGISSQASVIAAYGRRYSNAACEVGIIRYDDQDADPINVDKYDVLEDLPSHPRFQEFVTAASTEDNQNLRSHLADGVYIVKREPDDEHHLREVPSTVRMLLDSSTSQPAKR